MRSSSDTDSSRGTMDVSHPASGINRHHPRSLFSITLCYPISRRSRSAIQRLTTPSPACEESIHYPVFNPRDPRHNPDVAPCRWLDDDYDSSQGAASPRSIRWMQDLPRRSLRRAHKGLLALRSGIRRRPIGPQPVELDEFPSNWSADSARDSLDQQALFYSSTVSEASTAEDINFGADLQRISCKYPSEPNADISKYLQTLPLPFAFEEETCSPNGFTVRHSRSEAVLAAFTPETHPTKAPNGLPVMLQREAFQGNHHPAEVLNELDQAPASHGPRTVAATASFRPNNPNELKPSDSLVELKDQGLASVESPSMNSALGSNQNLQPVTRTYPEMCTASSSAPSNSRKSKALRMSINQISNYKPAMTRASKANRVSETPQIIDTELAMESLKLCDRLERSDSQASDMDRQGSQSESPFHSFNQSEKAPIVANKPCENEIDSQRSSPSGNQVSRSIVAVSRSADPDKATHVVDHEAVTASTADEAEETRLIPFVEDDTAGLTQNEERFAPEMSQILDDQWCTVETDDLASLLALRDEYFLVDKSTDVRPDRGNNAIKSERSFTGDGCLYSGPGLDRHSSTRTQGIPEIVGPSSAIQVQVPRASRAEREASDSTDEYNSDYPARFYFQSR
ncbi:uncharacterized protein BP01DRAFT_421902 [Aspergillus saccharolyticus JOP 1030-1]|uniref:Uncharacterized protein n=1 Tax=Aspergillus saccharolyticus JOP 1030-1 TaxID=1450539 RepID=A0A318ZMB9_9EURO|nr:hypothetical protein BP01DRAFT_421902 [Aspergillus saccharolyticus JOP 1030-1]PYH47624.1 hypothetical protein BP01DRAFT_421902 [Aspergillus saccharolyticus JOP 1030-1]